MTSYVIAKIKGISIQQTIFPTHLLNLSIDVIVFAIHNGIPEGIFPDPPRLSAIISSEISSLEGSLVIYKILIPKKKLERA